MSEPGKGGNVAPSSPPAGGGVATAAAGPLRALELPPPPAPAVAPEREERLALQAAMDSWLAANPVRREPDYGELQPEYRALKAAGHSVGRDGKGFVIDSWKCSRDEFVAKARKVMP